MSLRGKSLWPIYRPLEVSSHGVEVSEAGYDQYAEVAVVAETAGGMIQEGCIHRLS
jgi:hypothetical protein